MILKPRRSRQPEPSHGVIGNGHHQHSLPRRLSALLPARYLSTAHGFFPNIRKFPTSINTESQWPPVPT
jgi:hypothetical protein